MKVFLILLIIFLSNPAQAWPEKESKNFILIHTYITRSWDSLRRSLNRCEAFHDGLTGSNSLLYVPYGIKLPEKMQQLKNNCHIEIKILPKIAKIGDIKVKNLQKGLLYLPNPYIVPGDSFNEMYGWDSYFIILGLLVDHKLDYAEDMLKNIFFEIKHYGGILNANRSYYLTRSQPPFLTSMIKAIYRANHHHNRRWLLEAYKFSKTDYHFWTSSSHLAGNTGLSRYYDFDTGPVPEFSAANNHYYQKISRYLKTTLNAHFYAGDRAMRESGLDTTFRFGPFSIHTTDYAPVDLNSLLLKTEYDLAWMCGQLNRPIEARQWLGRAQRRIQRINKYLWNAEEGLYFDYDFKHKKQSHYVYLSTFYPLWAKAASRDQANKVVKSLNKFEKRGGLVTSPYYTGAQWDAPYGWAPLHYLAIRGLSNYHYHRQANRIESKFLKTILDNFLLEHAIFEKYNVVQRCTATEIKFGYTHNMIGFGWTNGVFLSLLKRKYQ